MDELLGAGYQGSGPVKTTLVCIDLPTGSAYLTDGGFVAYGGNTYVGEDAYYGILSNISPVRDGAESTTTRITVTILPSSADAAVDFGAASAQGSRVRWWEGVVNPATGALIGAPILKFEGELDKPRFSVGDSWEMVLECGTQAERQVEPNADWRLNHSFHSKIWPGELGLSHVTGVTRKVEWRERPPSPGLFKRIITAITLGIVK